MILSCIDCRLVSDDELITSSIKFTVSLAKADRVLVSVFDEMEEAAVKIWDLKTGDCKKTISYKVPIFPVGLIGTFDNMVLVGVMDSSDLKRHRVPLEFIKRMYNRVELRDLITGECLMEHNFTSDVIAEILEEYIPSADTVYISNYSEIWEWNFRKRAFENRPFRVTSCHASAYSNEYGILAIACNDAASGKVKVWDMETKYPLQEINIPNNIANIHIAGDFLTIGSTNGVIIRRINPTIKKMRDQGCNEGN